MRYILLGGNGYYGRNFQCFLMSEGIGKNEIIVIDKEITIQFKGIKYIQYNLTHFSDSLYSSLNLRNSISSTVIINFAAISFVDDSILNPDECINNNVKCLESAIQLYHSISDESYVKLIHISTDEVNVDKPNSEKSPYVKSKLMCEDILRNSENINYTILRPVNLMGYCHDLKCKELRQANDCLLKKISDRPDIVYIHGSGCQRRMFMNMTDACETLHSISIDDFGNKAELEGTVVPDKTFNIVDITDYPLLRTSNLQIKDIIIYLSKYYHFKYVYVDDPRGKYQDQSYLKGECEILKGNDLASDLKKIKGCI